MKTSDSIKNISKALLEVQRALEPVTKDSTNPHFKNKYASLPAIFNAVLPVLNKAGLVLVQGGDGNNLVTRLVDSGSGEWIEASIPLTPVKPDPQGMMSAVTYARRYGLSALVGVVTEEDDDGNAASGHRTGLPHGEVPGKSQQKRDVKPANKPATDVDF